MYLKKPLWSEGIETEIIRSKCFHGGVTIALTTGLRDARAEFSFLRLRALRSILNFLNSIADSDSTIYLFNLTQSIPQLQDDEIALGLRVLEGCCLLHPHSTALAHKHNAFVVTDRITS